MTDFYEKGLYAGYALATADAVEWCLAHDFPAVAEALQRGAHRGAS